jgi:hypothetical protein
MPLFEDRLGFVIELIDEAESELREIHRDAGFEDRSPAVGGRLRAKANVLAAQKNQIREIADGTFS